MRWLPVAVVIVSGCLDRAGANDSIKSDAVSDAAEVGASDTPAPAPDSTGLDPVFSELPDEWVEAPLGFCDELAHQSIATYNNDGDTIGIATGDRVRFIGVDATETNTADCYAEEGKNALRALLAPNKTICLYPDPAGPDKDTFDRLLRYVFIKVDGVWRMLNIRLVRLGAAKAYHDFLKGKQFRVQTEQAEILARDEARGGWGRCGWVIE